MEETMLEKDFKELIVSIKHEISKTQVFIMSDTNKRLINLYFKNSLVDPQSELTNDLQKEPYIFNIPFLNKKYREKELEDSMVERIRDVLLELGSGFSFVGNQYKITVGDDDFYLDTRHVILSFKTPLLYSSRIESSSIPA